MLGPVKAGCHCAGYRGLGEGGRSIVACGNPVKESWPCVQS